MAKKRIRQTNLIHLAEMLQVSKLIKREIGTDFEKRITGTPPDRVGGLRQLLCMFYGGFQAVEYSLGQTHYIKAFI